MNYENGRLENQIATHNFENIPDLSPKFAENQNRRTLHGSTDKHVSFDREFDHCLKRRLRFRFP